MLFGGISCAGSMKTDPPKAVLHYATVEVIWNEPVLKI